MKRLIYFLVGLGLVLSSCEKREETNGYPPADCKCGREADGIRGRYTDPHNLIILWEKDYRNNCTRNVKTRRESRYAVQGKPDWAEEKTWCIGQKW